MNLSNSPSKGYIQKIFSIKFAFVTEVIILITYALFKQTFVPIGSSKILKGVEIALWAHSLYFILQILLSKQLKSSSVSRAGEGVNRGVEKATEENSDHEIEGEEGIEGESRIEGEEKTDLNKKDLKGKTLLHLAVEKKNSNDFINLVESGASLQIKAPYLKQGKQLAWTAIELAIRKGSADIIEKLFEYKKQKGWTENFDREMANLLHFSIHCEQDTVSELIIKNCSSVNLSRLSNHYEHERTALSRVKNHYEHEWTALMMAAYKGNARVLNALGKKVDLEITNSCGQTALHFAALGLQRESINILNELEANLNSRDRYHRTPADLLCDLEENDEIYIYNYLYYLIDKRSRDLIF